jgi:hypothetical protein
MDFDEKRRLLMEEEVGMWEGRWGVKIGRRRARLHHKKLGLPKVKKRSFRIIGRRWDEVVKEGTRKYEGVFEGSLHGGAALAVKVSWFCLLGLRDVYDEAGTVCEKLKWL